MKAVATDSVKKGIVTAAICSALTDLHSDFKQAVSNWVVLVFTIIKFSQIVKCSSVTSELPHNIHFLCRRIINAKIKITPKVKLTLHMAACFAFLVCPWSPPRASWLINHVVQGIPCWGWSRRHRPQFLAESGQGPGGCPSWEEQWSSEDLQVSSLFQFNWLIELNLLQCLCKVPWDGPWAISTSSREWEGRGVAWQLICSEQPYWRFQDFSWPFWAVIFLFTFILLLHTHIISRTDWVCYSYNNVIGIPNIITDMFSEHDMTIICFGEITKHITFSWIRDIMTW